MEIVVRAATPEDRAQLERFPASIPFLPYQFLVALANWEVVAFLAWRPLVPEESEILQLETTPAFRRRGLARRLIQELKKQVPGSLFLEVRTSNLPARQLYEKEGFQFLLFRKEYYSCPLEDGIVLRFHPC